MSNSCASKGQHSHLSSASQTVKFPSNPTLREYFLKNSAQSAWNVPIRTSDIFSFPMTFVSRSFISLAALLVNVTAHIDEGGRWWNNIRWAIREVKTWRRFKKLLNKTREPDTLVFPLPGPARIWSGIWGECCTAEIHQRSKMGISTKFLPLSWAGLRDLR